MSNKFSKDPWRISLAAINVNCLEIVSGTERVAVLNAGDVRLDNDKLFANAELIVAAPALLQTVKDQHQAIDILMAMLIDAKTGFLPSKFSMWPTVVAADALVKKIEGVS